MTDYILKTEAVLDDPHGFVALVDSMPRLILGAGRNARAEDGVTMPGDQRIVDAARVSIAGHGVRPSSDDEKLIHYLVKNRHTTPLEQVRLTFHVRLPIFVARQWIRHRTGSFNEESARYGVLADDFYIPSIERYMAGGQAKKNKQGSGEPLSRDLAEELRREDEAEARRAYAQYEYKLARGVARELARIGLPVNIYTQWFWTTDLHNLMHFFALRLHEHAQWESRRYAQAMLPMATMVAPMAMAAFEKHREAIRRVAEQMERG